MYALIRRALKTVEDTLRMALPVGLEPTQTVSVVPRPSIRRWEHMVDKGRIELPTSELSAPRSNQLSYSSIFLKLNRGLGSTIRN